MAEWNCFKCKNEDDIALCSRCEDGSEYIIKTNADRIRSMTDEELAEFLHDFDECDYCDKAECDSCTRDDCDTHSVKSLVAWLQKECEV